MVATEKDDDQTPPEDFLTPGEAFDKFLNHVGGAGRWQWKMFFVTSFCGVFTAFQNLAASLIAAAPKHVCVIPELEMFNITIDLPNITRPSDGYYSQCSYYDRNYTELVYQGFFKDPGFYHDLPPANTISCNKWRYDESIYKTTVAKEWDLVCENKWLMSTIQSLYMAGVLFGALVLSELSDKFGRRTVIVVSAVGFLITCVATPYSPTLAVFMILRFCTAAFGSGLFLPNFVLLMEVVGVNYRTPMGIMFQGFFSVGFMLLPLIGYYIRDWRNLELAISIPSVLLLGYYWMPESPRWLLLQGREEEALDIMANIAKGNGRTMPPKDEVQTLVDSMRSQVVINKRIMMEAAIKNTQQNPDTTERVKATSILRKLSEFFKSQVILMRTPNMRRRCLIIFFAWFVVSMIYYGLTFSSGNINASVYLMLFLGGAVELPSYLLAIWTVNKFGRRLNLSTMFIICGAACLLILAVPKEYPWANIALANIGKFFNSSAFAIAYIFSAELIPTPVRNIAVGTSSMWARVGSALAPYIVDLLGDVHYAVPSTVFGVLSLTAGGLALLLPETGKSKLPETIKEVEDLPR